MHAAPSLLSVPFLALLAALTSGREVSALLARLPSASSPSAALDSDSNDVKKSDNVFSRYVTPSDDLPEQFKRLFDSELRDSRTERERRANDNLVVVSGGSQNLNQSRLYNAGALALDAEDASRPIKLVVWTPMVADMWDVQRAHRETWMTQPSVCHVDRWQDPECSVFPVWVYGNVSEEKLGNISALAGDVVETVFIRNLSEPSSAHRRNRLQTKRPKDQQRNLNLKTPFALEYAQAHFQWATHVVRMDADAFPYLDRVLGDLRRLPRRGLVYGPMERLDDERQADLAPCSQRLVVGWFSLVSADIVDCWVKHQRRVERMAALPFMDALSWSQPGEDVIYSKVLLDAQSAGSCPRLTCAQMMHAHRVVHPVR